MRYFLVLIVFSLVACENRQPSLSKVWLFRKAGFTEGQTDYNAEVINPMRLSSSSFINLEDDGKYTSYFGFYEQGTWDLKTDTLWLRPSASPKLIPFIVREHDEEQLELFYEPRQAIYSFDGYENGQFESGLENPFSYSNNKWRLQPDAAESEMQITERLKNHFRFYETYFSWADKLDRTTINVNHVPSPLRLYGNGFELIHYSQQPEEWQRCFYDTADVRKAYNQLYYLFYREDIDWKEKDGRFKMFADAFRQLQQKLK